MSAQDSAKIGQLFDRNAIEDLITIYAIALDSRDLDTAISCFEPDGEFRSVGGSIRGADALRDYYGERLAAWGPTFHVPHRVVVTFTDLDRATGVVIAHSEVMTEGKLYVAAHHYHDQYVRGDDGRWRFATREVLFLYSKPLAELGTIDPALPRRSWPGMQPLDADIPETLDSYRKFHAARSRPPLDISLDTVSRSD